MNDHNQDSPQMAMVPQSAGETAASAVATQAVATVQARYAIAKKMPRDLDQVRVSLLKECKRPRFADVAIYNKPIGKGIEGPSIRFAEAAIRCMGNILPEVATVFDDVEKRILRVSVTDLESNVTYSKDVTVTKTVERKKLKNGITPLSSRVNSYGDTVYTVPGTDDDILNKENALISKALRTLGLRLVPGDIIDEALDLVRQTMKDRAAKDPDAARKALVDAFATIGIQPVDLTSYLRHSIQQITPDELASLRGIYAALRDGEATWSDVIGRDADEEDDKPKETKTSRTAEKLKEKRAKSKSKAKDKTEPAPKKEKTPEKEEKSEEDQGRFDYGPPPMDEDQGAGF